MSRNCNKITKAIESLDKVTMVPYSQRLVTLVIFLYLSKLNSTEEGWRFFAGEGITRVIACQSLLVEHSLVGAEERPFCKLNDVGFIVFNGEADVEDLTATSNIGVVSIILSFAREGIRIVGTTEDLFISSWKTISQVFVLSPGYSC